MVINHMRQVLEAQKWSASRTVALKWSIRSVILDDTQMQQSIRALNK